MRNLVDELHGAFEKIHAESVGIVKVNDFDVLITNRESLGGSVCEFVVRSAAKVEQCCGGITTRLWDDPFEWTLPESFPDKESVFLYLEEVAAVRGRAFGLIKSDSDLVREISGPQELTTLFSILVDSLISSSKFLHLAYVALGPAHPENVQHKY